MQQNYQVKRFQHNHYVYLFFTLFFSYFSFIFRRYGFRKYIALLKHACFQKWSIRTVKPAYVHRTWFCSHADNFKEIATLQEMLLKFPIFHIFDDYALNYCIALPLPRRRAFFWNLFVLLVALDRWGHYHCTTLPFYRKWNMGSFTHCSDKS